MPVEVDFDLESVGNIGDLGIDIALKSAAVPEPATLVLLGRWVGQP